MAAVNGKTMKHETAKVYVRLPEEGSPTIRPTEAIYLGGNQYKLLPTENYDPEDEIWEFLPGSVVICEKIKNFEEKEILLATNKIEK